MTRQQRYRQRLKLQAAMTRALEALAELADAGLDPDERTARLAAQLIKQLVPFAVLGTETDLADLLRSPTDLSRCVYLKRNRQKETWKRNRRKKRAASS